MRILITGSEGLVGRALSRHLREAGHEVVPLDLRDAANPCDVRHLDPSDARCVDIDGIVHLAAVSRVVWGERHPLRCRSVNVGGTARILDVARACRSRPWVIFASSREVYGNAHSLPVRETAPLAPMNVYGRSKVHGERLVLASRADGLRTAVLRLSTVYGDATDHPDRVIPAFCRGVLAGVPLRVEGAANRLDPTHVDDVVRAIARTAELLARHGPLPPPVHLVSGTGGVTLRELAEKAAAAAGLRPRWVEAPPRSYDVHQFAGDPTLAAEVLGWRARLPLDAGLRALIGELRLTAPNTGSPLAPRL